MSAAHNERIAIVGGGLAGSLLALALARQHSALHARRQCVAQFLQPRLPYTLAKTAAPVALPTGVELGKTLRQRC